jgi:ABC-type multidrug transport system fused ATPase/permease subunit
MVDTRPTVPMSGGRRLDNFRGKIEFRNVWFKYPTRPSIWVLRNVSFTVEAGEIVALVGHSGSGKSTIVQLLLRFYDVDEGEILFDDVPIRYLSPRWIHQVVGVVQQDPQLFAMSVRDNIAYSAGRSLSGEALMAAAKVSYSEEFVMKMDNGYDSMITEKGGNLSGGQRQRIAIARAIVRNPTILITDEATSALDAASEKEVQRALDGVMHGRTSLIIAHRLGTIRAASMIHVFEMGELVESGTHDQLLAMDGHYARLVSRQLAREMGHSSSKEQMDDL